VIGAMIMSLLVLRVLYLVFNWPETVREPRPRSQTAELVAPKV
jgi:cytochrome b561